jgi:hypothetical protein
MSAMRRRLLRAHVTSAVMLASVIGGFGPVASQGSSSAPTAGATEAEVLALRQRAANFWAARVAQDPVKQWELLEPRGRARMSAQEYAGGLVAKYLAYQIEEADVQGSFALVKVRLIVQAALPVARQRAIPPSAAVVGDTWVRIDGTWYRSLDQVPSGPPAEAQQ